MKQHTPYPIPYHIQAYLRALWARFYQQITSPWAKLTVLAALYLLVSREQLNLSLSINGGHFFGLQEQSYIYDIPDGEDTPASNVSHLVSHTVSPTLGEKEWTPKQRRQLAYVAQYQEIALEEMRKHHIPASITLAQALLESNIGQSGLATKNNNHFGIKCFSRSCQKGHCSNFSDDSHKDFFRIYPDAKQSFHDHSRLLQKDRYAGLFQLSITDYKSWAHGLSAAGYATDPNYAKKLIRLIEDLDLDRWDRAV